VAHVFTSGSTGLPTAHCKTFGSLVRNVRSEAQRLGLEPGSDTTLVGTVPAQHMYGFESTVLLALHNRIAFHGGSPFFPADIVAALAATPGKRVLVTTPYHLRMLLAEARELPAVAMVVSATAPLAVELAREAEARFGAPLLEIYGCTEAGQLATRRPVQGDTWETFSGVRVSRRESPVPGEAGWYAEGGHIEAPTRLSDVLELHGPERFRLVGRDADMVNVAGKRASIAHLNHLLCAIPGVIDGAFFNPDSGARDVQRLTAFVVTETLTPQAVLAELRRRTDAVFLPRPLYRVDRLPRAATGKLPQAALAELARQCAAQAGGSRRKGGARP
jgi:acyl-coenzyme A synthetase/AMP-(fatty) acid ligase